MIFQIVLGTALIVLTLIVSAVSMGLTLDATQNLRGWLSRGNVHLKTVLAMAGLSLVVVAVMTVVVWVWALAFLWLEIFGTLEEALYFSIVSFTTLGFGDVILPVEWRLLSGFIAMDGFILFGLSTAFLFELLNDLRATLKDARAAQVGNEKGSSD